jgi:hypothetical protein
MQKLEVSLPYKMFLNGIEYKIKFSKLVDILNFN